MNRGKPSGVFVFAERGELSVKKRMGCPSTPIQGQPNLHDDCSYIDTMRHVKNFVQKINYIHNLKMTFWAYL